MWLLLVVFALVLVCVVVLELPQALWRLYRQWRALRTIPGWATHWFWGNLKQLKRDEATLLKGLAYIKENRYKLTRLWVGPVFPIVYINHCSAVEKVIKLPKCRSFYALYLLPWLGDGLLISEGKKWHRNRRLLTPAFHYEILKGYIPVVNNCLEVFLDKWATAAEDGTPRFLFKDVSKLSLDIIMRCAFSTESNCQLSETHPYIKTVYELVLLLEERFYTLLHRSNFFYYKSANGKEFARACKASHDYTESVIRERKQALNITGTNGGGEEVLQRASRQRKYLDFLDILLMARDEDGRGLTDLEIRDEADTFMFEGHDTTTSGMAWTLYCLALHPEHQDKVRQEVRNVLMGRQWLEYDDLKDLNYTTWCIKEAMRLYPPVFEIYRVATEDIEVEGHVIPKDILVAISTLQVHRHPDTWENPDKYDPLRFHPSNTEGRHPYAYIPFSAGSRNCIGQNFALNEEKMVIASVINRFQVTLDEEHKVEMLMRVILHAKGDIKVKLKQL